MNGLALVDTSVSLGTDGEFVVDLYQSEGYARLGVLAVDGSAEVNFVYPHQGDVAKSVTFLRELAANAVAMAANILTSSEPVTDSHTDSGIDRAVDVHGPSGDGRPNVAQTLVGAGSQERPETDPAR